MLSQTKVTTSSMMINKWKFRTSNCLCSYKDRRRPGRRSLTAPKSHTNLGERWIDWWISQCRKLDTNQRGEAQRVLSLHGKEVLQQMHHRDGGEERHLVVGELRHAQWHCVDESKYLQVSRTTRMVTPYGEKKLERVDVNYEFTTHENAILFRESKLACFPNAFITGITKPLTWFRMPPRFEDR